MKARLYANCLFIVAAKISQRSGAPAKRGHFAARRRSCRGALQSVRRATRIETLAAACSQPTDPLSQYTAAYSVQFEAGESDGGGDGRMKRKCAPLRLRS